MAQRYIDIQQNYKINEHYQSNQVNSQYWQRNEAFDKSQQKYVYIFAPKGAASFDITFYSMYKIFRWVNQQKSPHHYTDYRYGNYYYQKQDSQKTLLSRTLVRFLVKVIRQLKKNQGIAKQEEVKTLIFGKIQNLRKEKLSDQEKKKQIQSNYYNQLFKILWSNRQKTDDQLKKDPQFIDTPYTHQQIEEVWFQQQVLFHKVQVVSPKQKLKRIRQLSNKLSKKLWNIKLIEVRKDLQLILKQKFGSYLIVVDIPWNKTQNDYRQLRTLEQLIIYQKEKLIPYTKQDRQDRMKKLGRHLIKDLIYFQNKTNIDYTWLNPNNVIYDEIAQKYHLSFIPVLNWALGVSEKPVSFEQKFIYLTPQGPQYYNSPQMYKNKTSKATVCWQFMLLLDQFYSLQHLYKQFYNQRQLIQRLKFFESDYQKKNTRQSNKNNKKQGKPIFLAIVLKNVLKIKRLKSKQIPQNYQWYDYQKRPILQDIQQYFSFSDQKPNQEQNLKISFISQLIQKYQNLWKQFWYKNSKVTSVIAYVKRDIIEYFLKLIIWVNHKSLLMLNNESNNEQQQKRLLDQKVQMQKKLSEIYEKLYKCENNNFMNKNQQDIQEEFKWDQNKGIAFGEIRAYNEDIQDQERRVYDNLEQICQKFEEYFEKDILQFYKSLKKSQNQNDLEYIKTQIEISKIFIQIKCLNRWKRKDYQKINSIFNLADKLSSVQSKKSFESQYKELLKQINGFQYNYKENFVKQKEKLKQ